MVLQRESHVLLHGQRIVKRGVLKQKTDSLSDFAHLIESQVREVLTVDANRSRVRLLQADDEPQQYALTGTTAAQHRQGLAAAHAQADPVQNLLTSEGLMQGLDDDNWRTAVCLGVCRLHRDLIDYVHNFSRATYGKNMIMSFTSTTSARITNSEDKTTELVAARPTPAAPPFVRIPWKHAIVPMIKPKNAVLNVGGRKSLKSAPLKPLLMN